MPELRIQGPVLAWARELRGISAADAARRIGITEEELVALEAGEPLLKQSTIRKFSQKYQVPYGALFMPAPLPLDKPRQYRTFKGQPPRLSETTLLAWAEVNSAIDSFADLRLDSAGLVDISTLPTITREDDVETMAARERVPLRRVGFP